MNSILFTIFLVLGIAYLVAELFFIIKEALEDWRH